ncbi:MAG: hypothetical protein K8I30_11710, partial [Anaerolineae bacterium]|nr:hypothetical protein [Anaerolineae bacterium]
RNADTIMSEWQNLQLGDGIRLHKSIPALPVVTIEPNHYLVLGGAPTYTPEFKAEVGVSWLFYLDRKAGGHTRLIVRWRSYYPLTTAMRLSFGPLFIEPIHFTMERKMLLGIKARAERG